MNFFSKTVALGALAAATSSLAFATPVTPGGNTVAATNSISVMNDGILDHVSGNLSALTFTGTYTEYVIKDGSNPYGANDLTFVIAVTNNSTSQNGMEHVSDGDGGPSFAMYPSVNTGYLSSISGLPTLGATDKDAPVSVDETIYGTVEFNFTGFDAIAQGTGTQYLVIQTPATNFTFGNLGVIDSSTDTVVGLIPAAATPEPSSLMLLGTGLFGGAASLLRRRRNAVSL